MNTLKIGSEGPDVEFLVKLLEARNLIVAIERDIFTREIEAAVMAFQMFNLSKDGSPLKVDGVVGPKTWEALQTSDMTYFFDQPLPNDFTSMPENTDGTAIGRLALEYGIAEMNAGAGEVGGNNRGPWVAKYHKVDESVLTGSWAWCAAFTSWCHEQAAYDLGEPMPFKYSGGAQDIFRQLRNQENAYDPRLRKPEPGDVVVWWRGDVKSWKGHIGMVYDVRDDLIFVLEGNRGPYPSRVRVYTYKLDEMAKLIGFAHVRHIT